MNCSTAKGEIISSATLSLIRAAASGDATALKKLLVNGAEVNGTNPGGQTALILAALMGRSDIVRLLLEAGADVSLRDNLGLTATDWAQRKGFIDVTQLLKNPTSTGETQTRARQDQPGGFGPAAAAFLKTRAKLNPEPPLVQSQPPAEQSIQTESRKELAQDQNVWWGDNVGTRATDAALPTEPDTLRTRKETERIFEQARLRVEEEVRRKSQEQARRVTGNDASAEELRRTRQAAKENLKRCPKCNTIYEDDGRTYCAYDAGRLVNLQESLDGASTTSFGRPILWALVAITLVGSVVATYLATTYLNKNEVTSPPATVAAEKVPTAEYNAPVVGGALAGKQENVPKAEYPSNFRTTESLEPVTVVVRVSRTGRVISARALNGPRQLRVAAEQAARTAKFSEEKLKAEDRVVAGTITYTFKP